MEEGGSQDSEDSQDDESARHQSVPPPRKTRGGPEEDEEYTADSNSSGSSRGQKRAFLCKRSSSSLSDASDSSADSILWKHRFLQKKRRVLHSLSSALSADKVYSAFMARTIAGQAPGEDSALWQEARAILEELCGDPLHFARTESSKSMGPPPPKRRPGIDLSFVHQFCSTELDDEMKKFLLPTAMYSDSQWMAQSLCHIHGEHQQKANRVSDDDEAETTCPIVRSVPSTNTIDLDKAFVITPTAQ